MRKPFVPYFSFAILSNPRRKNGILEKGALISNHCDELVRMIPDVKRYFYLVERRGWYGENCQKMADIKLVDDPTTIEETRHRFPNAIVLEFSNADFVNTDIFKPFGISKQYDGIQIAAWEEFKRHDLFVKAAALLPQRTFIKFGHCWGKGDIKRYKLKLKTIILAKRLHANIHFPFWYFLSNKKLPQSAEEVNAIINTARMGILTTTREGVNRFKMECLSANIPVLVPEDVEPPTKKHINEKTGVFFKPTPTDLAKAIEYVLNHYEQFSPREYILAHTGIHKALPRLKEALQECALKDGFYRDFEEVFWDGRNQSMIWDKNLAVGEVIGAIKGT